MENASNALLIAGAILIAMLILGVGVYLFVNYAKVSESYEQRQETIEITKFNTNFTKFEGRKDITAQEIVTLKNFIKAYNEKNQEAVEIIVNNAKDTINKDSETAEDINFIRENSTDTVDNIIYFKCISIEYGNNDGKVDLIKFSK